MSIIREKISQDRIKDALSECEKLFKNKDKDLADQVLLLQARFKKLERSKMLGTITSGEANVEHASIVNAILLIVRAFEENSFDQKGNHGEEISEEELIRLKRIMSEMIDNLKLDEVFKLISENAEKLIFEKTLLTNLQNDFIYKGNTDPVYCARLRTFVGALRKK